MKKQKRNLFFLLATSVVLGIIVIVFLVAIIDPNFNLSMPVEVTFLLLTLFFSAATQQVFLRYLSGYRALEALTQRNEYNFGRKQCTFYDMARFQERMFALQRRFSYRGARQVLVAFTETTRSIDMDPGRHSVFVRFRAEITSYLEELFGPNGRYRSKKCLYCFYSGVFYLSLYGADDSTILALVSEISEQLMRIEEKNHFHVFVSPFFGLAVRNKDENLIELIENAEVARDTGERNFNRVTFYRASFRASDTGAKSKDIIEGLNQNEFVVYYQPKYSLVAKRFVSSEALIRWNSKKYGFLLPGRFIEEAEGAGLLHEIDMFVFRKVCEDLAENKRRGRRLLPVSVNFSLYEFYSPEFLDRIIGLLRENEIDPSLVQIEITERTTQRNPILVLSIIRRLKSLGIKVLMDDFGVGYSNLGSLRQFPFDAIKIDKSYIDNVETDEKARKMLQLMVEIAKVNDMKAIAEGAETKGQIAILKKFGCDAVQSFYYSKPIPKEDFDRFLLNNPFERKEEKE